MALRCKLTGLPKEVVSNDLARYLFAVGIRLEETQLEDFERHARSSSLVFTVPSAKMLKMVSELIRKTPFENRNLGFGRAPPPLLPPSNERTTGGSKPRHGSGNDGIESSKTKKKKKKKKSKAANGKEDSIETLAISFYEHLLAHHDQLQVASTREATGQIFRQFSSSSSRYVEAIVMARLRRRKLVKTTRVGEAVMTYFATREGTFPPPIVRKSLVQRMREMQEEQSVNKGGVVVSEVLDQTVAIGETCMISLDVSMMTGSDTMSSIVLDEVDIKGPHSDLFTMFGDLPHLLSEPIRIELSFRPTFVNLFRAAVHLQFVGGEKNFEIVRFVKVIGSDPVMDRLLQPVTPYVRKRITKYKATPPREVFEPPPQASNDEQRGRNPFAKLSHHKIPQDVYALLEANELENVIEYPDEASGEGYGTFWKNLLWATEFQEYQDIELFDMNQVPLVREGRLLSLTVPGLAENRPSVLRGDMVKVTWDGRLYKGRVETVRLLEVMLVFDPSFHRRYNPSVNLVDVRFTVSRMTLRTSHEGVLQAESFMTQKMLFPHGLSDADMPPRSVPSLLQFANPDLNPEQEATVRELLTASCRPLPYVCYGPPGTGKTTTVVEAIYQLNRLDPTLKILVTTPSNDAADLLCERLARYFPPSEMRRILAFSRSIETVPPAIQQYGREKSSSDEQLQDIGTARVVVATVNLTARFPYFGVKRDHFNVIVVDEAGHATEPELVSMISGLMNKGCQVILAGDPQQLGPYVSSNVCRKFGMEQSYLERLMKRELYDKAADGTYQSKLVTKLVKNYRSHPAILKLPNEMFYDGDLECAGDVMTTHSLVRWEHLPNPGFPVMFHAMQGENLREGNSPSWFNPQEAQQVVRYVQLLMKETRPPLAADDMCVITPYQRQAQKIRLALRSQDVTEIKVGSTEALQGQERRVVIVSTVRSQPEQVSSDVRYNLGFVAHAKRFNVAVTRAKTLLIVIGCPQVLALDTQNWLPFLKYCYDNNSWAGEEWNPNAVSEETSLDDDDLGDNEDDEEGLSHPVAQEAVALSSREE